MPNSPFNLILVPQGAEYQAISRALRQINVTLPVIPIPVGINSVNTFLDNLPALTEIVNHPQPKVLLMGVCGSLSPRYQVGDGVIYQNCIYHQNDNILVESCDVELINWLQDKLKDKANIVQSLTSDRVISTPTAKQLLQQKYNTDVVDMEGFAVLQNLKKSGFAVAMLRVVSDNSQHNIPDLSQAIDNQGNIKPLPLTIVMLKQPIAAIRLIIGALQALKVLQQITTRIFR